jgi:hypothetical protein
LPIVLDLDANGIELTGVGDPASLSALFDANGDGLVEEVGWIGAGDAFLALDVNGDGQINNISEISFAAYGGEGATDLQGLAVGFDSNRDGVFDARDAQFAEFKVWQDADRDGFTDAGELKSLGEAGIVSLDLHAAFEPQIVAGNIVFGTSSFARADGSTSALADVALAYKVAAPAGMAITRGADGALNAKLADGSTMRIDGQKTPANANTPANTPGGGASWSFGEAKLNDLQFWKSQAGQGTGTAAAESAAALVAVAAAAAIVSPTAASAAEIVAGVVRPGEAAAAGAAAVGVGGAAADAIAGGPSTGATPILSFAPEVSATPTPPPVLQIATAADLAAANASVPGGPSVPTIASPLPPATVAASPVSVICPLQSGPKVNLDWTLKETEHGQEARA